MQDRELIMEVVPGHLSRETLGRVKLGYSGRRERDGERISKEGKVEKGYVYTQNACPIIIYSRGSTE